MTGELGKASLDLEANLAPFEKSMKSGQATADDMKQALDALAAVSKIAEEALQQVKMKPGQGAESKVSAEEIVSGVRGISEEARTAARELDNVKIGQAQAAESKIAAEEISGGLDQISRNADQAKRKLAEVNIASRNPGAGVGPFGSGFGRIGVLGTAIGGGILATPAAGPAALGALAAIPVLAGAGAGALGTLALAFDGVGKAIGGDKKAFDGLVPAQQQFVLTVRSLDGELDKLKQTAAKSLFPGLTDALHSALSPGTLSAVTTAITEFGKAIGQAGAEWGRYFGSSQFQQLLGPLMASGARIVTLLSDAFLHLFDALGVLGKAAIPFTSWLTTAIDDGSKFVDTWLRAKTATGQLGGALDEAKTSLALVARLAESLVNAVVALGAALYPVSKIAVKDLTDGLNALAGVIGRNQDVIREIISSALTVLVTAVKLVADGIRLVVEGWEHVLGQKAAVVTAFVAIGAALLLAMGPISGPVAGAILAIGLIEQHWAAVVGFMRTLGQEIINAFDLVWVEMRKGALNAALNVVEPFSHLPGVLGGWARKAKDSMQSELDSLNAPNMDWSNAAAQQGAATGAAWANAYNAARATVNQTGTKAPAGYKPGSYGSQPSTRTNPGGFTPGISKIPNASYTQSQIAKLLIANGVPKDVATNLSIISARGEDPSGSPYALNNNASTGDYSVGLFQENFLGQMGVDRTKKFAPQFGLSPTTPVKDFVTWLGKHPSAQAQIAYQIYQSQGYGAWTTAAGLGITGGGSTTSPFGTIPPFTKNTGPKPVMPTSANLLPEDLRNALQKAKDKATSTQGATAAQWLNVELADLDKAQKDLQGQLAGSSGKKKAAIQQELRSIDGQIASVNKQITTNLHAQAQAIKTAFSSQLSTAKSNISAAMSTLKATLDAQLQANLQTYIDTVLGPRFFQGTDTHGMPLQTPTEAKLAAEQAADTLKSLQDAITAATDPATRDAAQHQLDEYNDSIQATKERAQADYDYAQAVKQAQADEQEAQRQLNLQLDTFSKGLADGTTKLSDLGGIVGAFGLSLTAPGGIADDFSTLGDAVTALVLVLATEAQKLVGVGDTKDANAINDVLGKIGATSAGGGLTSGLGGAAGFFKLNPVIPSLDVGGFVEQTGIAMVHRGETFSGVGGAGGPTVIVNGVVGNSEDVAMQIGRAMEKLGFRGIKFQLA